MASYDFSTLNDKDFEELTRDLLSISLGIRLQNFKIGHDKGIDLRYSSPSKNNKIVVQAKHYYKTGFRGLISALKKERLKVENLRPARYIISTSINLSAKNKDEILNILKPYLKSANDIFGNEDLNKLLSDFPDIENRYYKLWLTSSAILKRLLNNSVKGRSEFYIEKIKENIKTYVENSSLKEALKILEKYKFLLITGQPGVGKTTLAYMTIYSFLAKKYELIVIDREIKEAENLFSPDPKSKQIFYFDDFLGSNYYEIINPKSSDSGIVNFVERIRKSKNKYLILTTRTTILNTAKQFFEKIHASNFDIARKELELKDYNDLDKAKILYNHLYFGNLSEINRHEIFKNKNYWKIIRHENYNPRLIEFITSQDKFDHSGFKNYLKFVTHNLDNPNELWTHSYENQIKDEDRFFISTLFSFGSHVEHFILEKAFENRVKYEVKKNGFQRPNDVFNSSLKRIIDGFVKRYETFGGSFEFSFVNPSINDFLISYFKKSKIERWRLFNSCIYIEQFESLFKSLLFDFTDYNDFIKETFMLIETIKSKDVLSIEARATMSDIFLLVKMAYLYSYIGRFDEIREKTTPLVYKILKEIDFEKLDSYRYIELMKYIMESNLEKGIIEDFFVDNWEKVINSLFNCAVDLDDCETIVEIFESYSIDFEGYSGKLKNKMIIREIIERIADEKTSEAIYSEKNYLESPNDFEELKKRVTIYRSEIFSRFRLSDHGFDENYYFDGIDETLFKNNQKKKTEEKVVNPKIYNRTFTEKDIDDLFYFEK